VEEHIIHRIDFMDLPSGRRAHPFFPVAFTPRTRDEARDWFRALRRDKDDDLLADPLLALLEVARGETR
jgi:hypothetical protein